MSDKNQEASKKSADEKGQESANSSTTPVDNGSQSGQADGASAYELEAKSHKRVGDFSKLVPYTTLNLACGTIGEDIVQEMRPRANSMRFECRGFDKPTMSDKSQEASKKSADEKGQELANSSTTPVDNGNQSDQVEGASANELTEAKSDKRPKGDLSKLEPATGAQAFGATGEDFSHQMRPRANSMRFECHGFEKPTTSARAKLQHHVKRTLFNVENFDEDAESKCCGLAAAEIITEENRHAVETIWTNCSNIMLRTPKAVRLILKDFAINVTHDGLIKKKILSYGNGIKLPRDGKIWFHYVAYADGALEPYDSTLNGLASSIRLDESVLDTLSGLRFCLQSMEMLETSQFIIDSKYAYGNLGYPPHVGSFDKVVFTILALNFVPKADLRSGIVNIDELTPNLLSAPQLELGRPLLMKKTVSYNTTSQGVFAQTVEMIEKTLVLKINIAELFKGRNLFNLRSFEVGKPCLAPYLGNLYRAEIIATDLQRDLVRVFFSDIGITDCVKKFEVFVMLSGLAKIPRQLYQCQVEFRDHDLLEIVPKKEIAPGKYIVGINASAPTRLTPSIKRAVKVSFASGRDVRKIRKPFSGHQDIPLITSSYGRVFLQSCTVSRNIRNLGEVRVIDRWENDRFLMGSPKDDDARERVHQLLNDGRKFEKYDGVPQVGELVIGHYRGREYRRAVVTSPPLDDYVSVEFMDFGNTVANDIRDLRVPDDEILAYPLYGVTVNLLTPHSQPVPTEEAEEAFDDNVFLIEFQERNEGLSYEFDVDLWIMIKAKFNTLFRNGGASVSEADFPFPLMF